MNNQKEKTLRDCQFCKTNADVHTTFSDKDKECFVKCFNCGATGPSVRFFYTIVYGNTPVPEMRVAEGLWDGHIPTRQPERVVFAGERWPYE